MQCRPWPPAHRRDLRSLKKCPLKNFNFRRHMNRYQANRQDRTNLFSGAKRSLTGDSRGPHSQEDDMDTRECIASAQVAAANGYPPCLITALLSKTNEQAA